jgi:hypothetical protein
MTTNIYFEHVTADDWNTQMEVLCICGNPLCDHAFTMRIIDENTTELRVSQCVLCSCKEFHT